MTVMHVLVFSLYMLLVLSQTTETFTWKDYIDRIEVILLRAETGWNLADTKKHTLENLRDIVVHCLLEGTPGHKLPYMSRSPCGVINITTPADGGKVFLFIY